MKLTIYKASDGDCSLLSDAADSTHLLVDGGRSGAFEDHVAGALEDLHSARKSVRAVCVSHIDDDHISGVLKLIERKVAWVRHRFQIGDSDVWYSMKSGITEGYTVERREGRTLRKCKAPAR